MEDGVPRGSSLEDNIDFTFLANNFELTGSRIKSIAIQAAYYAADEGVPDEAGAYSAGIANRYGKDQTYAERVGTGALRRSVRETVNRNSQEIFFQNGDRK